MSAANGASEILADLRRAGFTVALGPNDFDLIVRPSVLRIPNPLFERLVEHQDALRALLRAPGEERAA